MPAIKVLFVTHSAELGGAENSLLDILSHIDRSKFEIFLLAPLEGPITGKARSLGAPVFIVKYKYWLMPAFFSWKFLFYIIFNIISAFKIALLIDRIKPDLVYTNSSVVISAALAAKIRGIPHIWSIHETIGRKKGAFRFLGFSKSVQNIICILSKIVIVDSDYIKRTFPKKYEDKIKTVYYGFDISGYKRNEARRKELRRIYGISEEERVITLVGVICNRKGQKESVLAMPLILKEEPKARLLLAGESFKYFKRYEDEVRSLASSESLKRSVSFLGFKENISDIYNMTDVLILPSSDEPFGRAIVEAMLFEVPVIGARVGGIPEIIEDSRNGILINTRAPETIAGAVLKMLKSPDSMRQYAKNAKESAQNRFNMMVMKENIEKILEEVLS